MGTRSKPLLFVCRGCGCESSTSNTGNKGIFCGKACRADFERKGRSEPVSYVHNGYRRLQWTQRGGTKRRPRRGLIFEHRAVWEAVHGPVPIDHVIHHINGDKLDNRIENLQLMRRSDHVRHHAEERRAMA